MDHLLETASNVLSAKAKLLRARKTGFEISGQGGGEVRLVDRENR